VRDYQKTKGELLRELDALRRHVSELEQAQSALRPSEKQLKELFDNAVVGIYRTTPDGRIIMANSTFVQMLGFSSFEELSEKKVDDEGFAPGYPRPTFKDLIEKKGKVIGFESAFLRRDGTTIFVRENARVVRDSSSRVLYYEGVVEDITERKKAEEELQAKTGILQNIISNIPYYIFWKDKNSVYLGCNDNFAKLAGTEKPEDVIGKTDYDLPWKKEESDFYRKIDKEVMSKVTPILNIEEPVHQADGKVVTILTSKVPMQNANGEVTGVLGIFTDITECKRTEATLRESEKLVRAILDATTESVLLLDKQGTILSINETAARRFGRSVEEIVGLNAWDVTSGLIPPDLIKSRREQLNKVIRSGEPIRFEDQREGMIFDTNYYPIFDADEKISRVAIFGHDITEQRRAEQATREAKLRYQTLFESAPVGIGTATREGQVLECNDAMLQMTGYSFAELKRINLADTYQEPQLREALLRRLQTDGCVHDFEAQLKRKDGTAYYASLTITPLTLGGQGMLLTVQKDITKRKRNEDLLERSENKYRTLLENLPQKIFLKDRDSVYISCNENYARDLKIKPEEIVGKTDYDFYPKELAEKYRADDKRIIASAKTEDIKEKYIQNGRERTMHTVKTPVTDEQGEVIGVLGIFWDITEQKKAEKELDAHREKIARAEQLVSLGTISASLTHELTQPLTVARLSIESALAKPETRHMPGAVEKKFRDCLSGVSDACSIIKRFRDYTRGMARTVVTEISLKPVAERIVKLLEGNAIHANVSVLVKDLDRLPPIYVTERDIELLFSILIDNAIQAANGKEEHHLTISGAVKDEHIELQFADDCGGIAPENLDKIFEMFFTTKPIGKGTGLGLCIVKQIVSQTGGKVCVESEMGKGSTFFVTLPIKIGGKL
jgi:PAS domain S-box-containing protein